MKRDFITEINAGHYLSDNGKICHLTMEKRNTINGVKFYPTGTLSYCAGLACYVTFRRSNYTNIHGRITECALQYSLHLDMSYKTIRAKAYRYKKEERLTKAEKFIVNKFYNYPTDYLSNLFQKYLETGIWDDYEYYPERDSLDYLSLDDDLASITEEEIMQMNLGIKGI